MIGTIQHQGVEIDYDYVAAVDQRGPSYNSGGEPSIEATLEITDATMVDETIWWQESDFRPPDNLLEWAREDWLVEDMCWEHATETKERTE